jgi:hypothetical protein
MRRAFASTCALLALCALCAEASATSVTVLDKKIGTTQKYSGINVHPYATEAPGWLAEMGINWVRVLNHSIGGRSSPFSGVSTADVKANPDRIDWSAVDSFYSYDRPWLLWAKDNGAIYTDGLMWSGNKQADALCPSQGIRKFTPGNAADEDLYWVGIFAYAYWANVKNQLHMTHLEVSNEPDNCDMGVVNVDGHNRMTELAKDALGYVNGTLVSPALPAVVLGPGVLSQWDGRKWLTGVLTTPSTAAALDIVTFHAYWEHHWIEEIGGGVDYIRSTAAGRTKPIWISEWGQFWTSYSTAADVQTIAATVPKLAVMGVEAAAIYELSPWGSFPQMGLVGPGGVKTRMYWDMKLLNRALSFEKDMLETSLPNDQADTLFAYATRDRDALYLIVLNNNAAAETMAVDVSAFADVEGKAVTVYKVAGGAGPYSEESDPATTVRGGSFTVQAQPDTHYVAVVAGAGAADAGAAGAGGSASRDAGGAGGSTKVDAGGGKGGASPGTDAASFAPSDPAAPDETTEETSDSPSASCRTAHAPSRASGVWIAALALALAARRRRSR